MIQHSNDPHVFPLNQFLPQLIECFNQYWYTLSTSYPNIHSLPGRCSILLWQPQSNSYIQIGSNWCHELSNTQLIKIKMRFVGLILTQYVHVNAQEKYDLPTQLIVSNCQLYDHPLCCILEGSWYADSYLLSHGSFFDREYDAASTRHYNIMW